MIIKANAAQIPLADNSVHCVVTSSPYWGLRKYQGHQDTTWPDGTCCAYGLEPTIAQYVEHSLVILREVRRVLRDDGTCWWNLGDSYSARGRGSSEHHVEKMGLGTAMAQKMGPKTPTDGLKPLDLCLIPERVALAAQADGWYVRSLVIWSKPNPLPESVNGWRWERHRVKVAPQPKRASGQTAVQYDRDHSGGVVNADQAQWADCPGCERCEPNEGLVLRKGSWRPTDAYEHILMLAKTADYFGDAEAVKENGVYTAGEQRGPGEHKSIESGSRTTAGLHDKTWTGNGTRNLRNVWTFPTQPYPEAHFATFPERLPEICIKASTSERGCCPKCGAHWARVIERSVEFQSGSGKAGNQPAGKWNGNAQAESGDYDIRMGPVVSNSTLGWRPSCSCKEVTNDIGRVVNFVSEAFHGEKELYGLWCADNGKALTDVQNEILLKALRQARVVRDKEIAWDGVQEGQQATELQAGEIHGSLWLRVRQDSRKPDVKPKRICSGSSDGVRGEDGPGRNSKGDGGSPHQCEQERQSARKPNRYSEEEPQPFSDGGASTKEAARSGKRTVEAESSNATFLIWPSPIECLVLDPFGGSGTTARVALRLNRRAISIDLAYHELAKKRTREVQPQLMIS